MHISTKKEGEYSERAGYEQAVNTELFNNSNSFFHIRENVYPFLCDAQSFHNQINIKNRGGGRENSAEADAEEKNSQNVVDAPFSR